MFYEGARYVRHLTALFVLSGVPIAIVIVIVTVTVIVIIFICNILHLM